ncbi:hypothetical protein [Effusibacillus consociatus]|uniref:Uncharacterized protein n=1 Tax=Effusibacillus consociatus TaxID=1117041 RepID=A0ABV9PXT5_9BACL
MNCSNPDWTCKKCGGIFPGSEWIRITDDYAVTEGPLACPNLGCTALDQFDELSSSQPVTVKEISFYKDE